MTAHNATLVMSNRPYLAARFSRRIKTIYTYIDNLVFAWRTIVGARPLHHVYCHIVMPALMVGSSGRGKRSGVAKWHQHSQHEREKNAFDVTFSYGLQSLLWIWIDMNYTPELQMEIITLWFFFCSWALDCVSLNIPCEFEHCHQAHFLDQIFSITHSFVNMMNNFRINDGKHCGKHELMKFNEDLQNVETVIPWVIINALWNYFDSFFSNQKNVIQ